MSSLWGIPYEIRDGKIQSESCELNVCHHCNLSCRGCSHLSPRVGKFFVDPDTVFRDFSILANYYHPRRVCLLGGEPLLHPALLDVVQAVRSSGICQCVRLLTNGTLLGRMPERIWKSLDQVHVSVHPGARISTKEVKNWQAIAHTHGVGFELRFTDRFWETCSGLGTPNQELVNRIYSACQIAHTWRCHAVCNGFFFRCSESIFIPQVLGHRSGLRPMVDGLRLETRQGFTEALLHFLMAREPLASCAHCLGTVGKRFSPVQEPRRVSGPPRTTEELIDWDYLVRVERRSPSVEFGLVKRWGASMKRMLSSLPLSIRLHPFFRRAIAKLRHIHPAFH